MLHVYSVLQSTKITVWSVPSNESYVLTYTITQNSIDMSYLSKKEPFWRKNITIVLSGHFTREKHRSISFWQYTNIIVWSVPSYESYIPTKTITQNSIDIWVAIVKRTFLKEKYHHRSLCSIICVIGAHLSKGRQIQNSVVT